MKRFSLKESFLLFISLFFIFSYPLPAEIWRSFTSMDDPHEIAYFEGCVWGAAEGGLFKFHLADSSFDIYTLADGLKGEDFLCLEIDSTGKIFSSGTGANLNVMNPASGEILSFTYLNSEAEKLTDIFISGASIFAAANDGVYEYYFDDNYDEYFVRGGYKQLGNFPINSEVRCVRVYDGYLWAGTNSGIARIALSVPNKQPPLNWENFTTADGLPSGPIRSLEVFAGDLIAASQNNGIAKYNGIGFESIPITNNIGFDRIRVLNDTIFAAGNSGVKKLENGSWIDVGEQIGKFYDVITDNFGNLWGAKSNSFYVKGGLKGFDDLNWHSFSGNTPAGSFIRALMVDSQGRLWCGGVSGAGKGVYVYDKGVWTNYTAQDSAYNVFFYNHVSVSGEGPRAFVEHPNGEIWAASFGSGIAVFRPDGEQYYYSSVAEASKDSIARLSGTDGSPDYCAPGNMVVDEDNDIWIVTRASADEVPVYCATADFLEEHSPNIEWLSYTASDVSAGGTNNPYFDYLIIDQQNRLWYGGDDPAASGVGMLDFKGTPYNKSDDISFMSGTGQNLSSGTIYDLTIDGENRIWVATGSGVNSFYIPDTVINSTSAVNYDTPYFLDGIKTNCIAVDPMQNKWFGTDDGIVVLSEDNYTILDIYSAETHPLLANTILDITFNPATGEAFIATNRGISSLITPFRSFGDKLGSLELFPVPFIPDGNNLLRFGQNSLTEGVTVKIFTHTGLLVKKLSFFNASLGWDGTDYNGKLVGSGIYLIIVASDNGQSAIGKAAVIRR